MFTNSWRGIITEPHEKRNENNKKYIDATNAIWHYSCAQSLSNDEYKYKKQKQQGEENNKSNIYIIFKFIYTHKCSYVFYIYRVYTTLFFTITLP